MCSLSKMDIDGYLTSVILGAGMASSLVAGKSGDTTNRPLFAISGSGRAAGTPWHRNSSPWYVSATSGSGISRVTVTHSSGLFTLFTPCP